MQSCKSRPQENVTVAGMDARDASRNSVSCILECLCCCWKELFVDDVGDARIKSLNLTANNIGDKGALALAEMLKV